MGSGTNMLYGHKAEHKRGSFHSLVWIFKVFFGNSFGGFIASQPLGEAGSAVVPDLKKGK